jgi:hypothetical protein
MEDAIVRLMTAFMVLVFFGTAAAWVMGML